MLRSNDKNQPRWKSFVGYQSQVVKVRRVNGSGLLDEVYELARGVLLNAKLGGGDVSIYCTLFTCLYISVVFQVYISPILPGM